MSETKVQNDELQELQEALAIVRNDPESVFSLTLLRERVKPFFKSPNRDVRELAEAVSNLLIQINSGIVSVSTKFLPLLEDISGYFERNINEPTNTERVDDVLGRVDFEASGGNSIELGESTPEILGSRTSEKPISNYKPEKSETPTKKPKAMPSPRVDSNAAKIFIDTAFELEQIERFQYTIAKLQSYVDHAISIETGSVIADKSTTHTKGLASDKLAKTLQDLKTEFQRVSAVMSATGESKYLINHVEIEKLIQKMVQGTHCELTVQSVEMHPSLWLEIQRAFQRLLEEIPSNTRIEGSIGKSGSELVISLTFCVSLEEQASARTFNYEFDHLRDDFFSLGGRLSVVESDDSETQLKIHIPGNNRVIPVLTGTIDTNTYAIPTHYVDHVLPISDGSRALDDKEISYQGTNYPLLDVSQSKIDNHYYLLLNTRASKFAIPFSSVRTNQNLVLRQPSNEICLSYGGAILDDSSVCILPDVTQFSQTDETAQRPRLTPHILVVHACDTQLNFITQVCNQFGISVSSATNQDNPLSMFQEYRPVATVVFDGNDSQIGMHSTLMIKELTELCDVHQTPLTFYRQEDVSTEDNVQTEATTNPEKTNVCADDQQLYDWLTSILQTSENPELEVS